TGTTFLSSSGPRSRSVEATGRWTKCCISDHMSAIEKRATTGAVVRRQAIGETAEGYVEALISQQVSCLFLNPGTDTFPIQEALSKLAGQGRPVPRAVLCLFEVVALAAAHGYYAATGQTQAVLVHVDVGTQN